MFRRNTLPAHLATVVLFQMEAEFPFEMLPAINHNTRRHISDRSNIKSVLYFYKTSYLCHKLVRHFSFPPSVYRNAVSQQSTAPPRTSTASYEERRASGHPSCGMSKRATRNTDTRAGARTC